MPIQLLRHWVTVYNDAQRRASRRNARDRQALATVDALIDVLESGGQIPMPTPEINACLAHAEVLARR